MKIFLFLYLVLLSLLTFSQDFSNPYDYLKFMEERNSVLMTEVWNFTKIMAHKTREKKIEKARSDLLQTIDNISVDVASMPAFNNSTSLRDSLLSLYSAYKSILTKDVIEVQILGAKASESYHAMQLYLNKNKKLNDNIAAKTEAVTAMFKDFANKHNIKLVDDNSKFSAKIRLSNIVLNYYNNCFLNYFHLTVTEGLLLTSLHSNDSLEYESFTDTLRQVVKEVHIYLSTINDFDGDVSLIDALENNLRTANYFLKECVPVIDDFFRTENALNHWKKIIGSKLRSELTEYEINAYNSAVDDYNNSVKVYNQKITDFTNKLKYSIELWDKRGHNFLNNHIPK